MSNTCATVMTPETHEDSRASWRPGFWSLFTTQFQVSFSDNALKFLLISFISGMSLSEDKTNGLVLATNTLFSAPFILFSMTGGYFADRFSKRSVIIGTRIAELIVM